MSIPVMDGWSDDEVKALVDAGNAELTRRWAAQNAPARAQQIEADAAERLDEVSRSWHRAAHDCPGGPDRVGTLQNPTPWEPVTEAHKAWPRGWHVTHTGRIYRSQIPNNRQAPPHPAWDDLGPLEDA